MARSELGFSKGQFMNQDNHPSSSLKQAYDYLLTLDGRPEIESESSYPTHRCTTATFNIVDHHFYNLKVTLSMYIKKQPTLLGECYRVSLLFQIRNYDILDQYRANFDLDSNQMDMGRFIRLVVGRALALEGSDCFLGSLRIDKSTKPHLENIKTYNLLTEEFGEEWKTILVLL